MTSDRSERKRIEVPEELPKCRECGAECDIVHIADGEDVEAGGVLGEVRCSEGHVQLYFLKASQEAIDLGRELHARYRW